MQFYINQENKVQLQQIEDWLQSNVQVRINQNLFPLAQNSIGVVQFGIFSCSYNLKKTFILNQIFNTDFQEQDRNPFTFNGSDISFLEQYRGNKQKSFDLAVLNWKGQLNQNMFNPLLSLFQTVIIHAFEFELKDDKNFEIQNQIIEQINLVNQRSKSTIKLYIILRDVDENEIDDIQNGIFENNDIPLLKYQNINVFGIQDLSMASDNQYLQYLEKIRYQIFNHLEQQQKEGNYYFQNQNLQKFYQETENIYKMNPFNNLKHQKTYFQNFDQYEQILQILRKDYNEDHGFYNQNWFAFRFLEKKIKQLERIIWESDIDLVDQKQLLQKYLNQQKEVQLTKIMSLFIQILTQNENWYQILLKMSQELNLLAQEKSRNEIEKQHALSIDLKNLLKIDYNEMSKQEKIELKNIKKQIELGEEKLNRATISLDIFWRELFAIMKQNKDTISEKQRQTIQQRISQFCQYGERFEFIDGDNGQINYDLLNQLSEQYKGQNILIISVLGAQSTGKSTLLNYLFGCQFSTSAGRCTRGVYISILEVSEKINDILKQNVYNEELKELNENLKTKKYDYLVILDTEGLDDGKKKDRQFDKNITLFCLAVSNVLLLNVSPNLSQNFKEILQISAYNISQMKKNKIKGGEAFLVYNKQNKVENEKQLEEESQEIVNGLYEYVQRDQFTDIFSFQNKGTFNILTNAFNTYQLQIQQGQHLDYEKQQNNFFNKIQQLLQNLFQGFLRQKKLDFTLQSWIQHSTEIWKYMQQNPYHQQYDKIQELGDEKKIIEDVISITQQILNESPAEVSSSKSHDQIDNYYVEKYQKMEKEFNIKAQEKRIIQRTKENMKDRLKNTVRNQKLEALLHYKSEESKKKYIGYKDKMQNEMNQLLYKYKRYPVDWNLVFGQGYQEKFSQQEIEVKKSEYAKEIANKIYDEKIQIMKIDILKGNIQEEIYGILLNNQAAAGLKIFFNKQIYNEIKIILQIDSNSVDIQQVYNQIQAYYIKNITSDKIFQYGDLDLDSMQIIKNKLNQNTYVNLNELDKTQMQNKYKVAYNFLYSNDRKSIIEAKQVIFQDIGKMVAENINWEKIFKNILYYIIGDQDKQQNLFKKFSSDTIKLIRGKIQEIINDLNKEIQNLGLQLDGQGEMILHYFSTIIIWKLLSFNYLTQFLQPLESLEEQSGQEKSYKQNFIEAVQNTIQENDIGLTQIFAELTSKSYKDSLFQLNNISEQFQNSIHDIQKEFKNYDLTQECDQLIFKKLADIKQQKQQQYFDNYKNLQDQCLELAQNIQNIEFKNKIIDSIVQNNDNFYPQIQLIIYINKQIQVMENIFDQKWQNYTYDLLRKQYNQIKSQINLQLEFQIQKISEISQYFSQVFDMQQDQQTNLKASMLFYLEQPIQEVKQSHYSSACFQLLKKIFNNEILSQQSIIINIDTENNQQKQVEFCIQNKFKLELLEQIQYKWQEQEQEQQQNNKQRVQFEQICQSQLWTNENNQSIQQIQYPILFLNEIHKNLKNIQKEVLEEQSQQMQSIYETLKEKLLPKKNSLKVNALGCRSQCKLCFRKCCLTQDHYSQNNKSKHMCNSHLIRGMNGIQQGNTLVNSSCNQLNLHAYVNIKKKNGHHEKYQWKEFLEEYLSDWDLQKKDNPNSNLQNQLEQIWEKHAEFFIYYYSCKNKLEGKEYYKIYKPFYHYSIALDYSTGMRRQYDQQQNSSKWIKTVDNLLKFLNDENQKISYKSLNIFKYTHQFNENEDFIYQQPADITKLISDQKFQLENISKSLQKYSKEITLEEESQANYQPEGSGKCFEAIKYALNLINKDKNPVSHYRILLFFNGFGSSNFDIVENMYQQLSEQKKQNLMFIGLTDSNNESNLKSLKKLAEIFRHSYTQGNIQVQQIQQKFQEIVQEQANGFDI